MPLHSAMLQVCAIAASLCLLNDSQMLLQAARAAPNGASIWCSKLHGPNTVILGDAAHGVTPALGQGCNAALESAVTLSEVLPWRVKSGH